jgi:signal transduction histidine kinase
MDKPTMTLANTYQRFYIILLCLLLAMGCLAYYLTIRYVLIHQVDNDLKIERQELLDFVQLHDSLPAPSHVRDQELDWAPGQAPASTGQPAQEEGRGYGHHSEHEDYDNRVFENAMGTREHGRGQEAIRRLRFPVQVRGQWYDIRISKSLEETEDLLWLILWVTVGSLGILILGLYLGNRFLLRRIWGPFYHTLEYLKKFSLSDPPPDSLVSSRIDEFALLNRSVQDMTAKMQSDYLALQQFTDHAAHEMQTPLAVIKSKLDLMMQHPGLDQVTLEQMNQLLVAVGRLSRLNQSLLLLARIENRQFLEKETLDLSVLIEEKIDLFQEWIAQFDLSVTQVLEEVKVEMHPYLAESLINNLLSNAVRHNVKGGVINIILTPGSLRVSNTGQNGPLDNERLFHRFQKQFPSEGVGLGLTIAKEIAELSGMHLRYFYSDGLHTFMVIFH